MKLLRLQGRKTCERVLRHSKVWRGKHMQIRWVPGHPRHPSARTSEAVLYVGTLASTKLDKSAVNRNRMRRRCREALRLIVDALEIPVAVQLLIAPRSSSLKAPFLDLQEDLRTFLSTQTHARSTQAQK